ncbi:hypothetical protein GCM10010399_17490 [Dactylosporangium fulvum]|uniref:PASTA domain-containing protein n=1 Tax=Dactylosporangium fulvum TaxID=53359 RepID=A0ABY5VYJ6_9ACTN|nr:PASTA domain-containing protein [Dactylosporangium fulvum]UWP82803.1 PASTA domain-containing protein [Dactylosporangium fulvum]
MPHSPDQSSEPDRTQPFGQPGPESDQTRPFRPLDEQGPDETVHDVPPPPAADPTAVQPPVDDAPRWSARANVPRPGDPGFRRPAPQEWVTEEEDPYQGRSWLTPVIVGMVALVLVAVLTTGIWLIYRATEQGANTPEDPAPALSVGSSAVPLPTTAATTEEVPSSEPAPTTTAPSPAGPVVVPRLRGATLAEATVKLQVLGLNVAVERKADGSVAPGEVLSTRPGEGEAVEPGDTVTLVVATAPVTVSPPSVPAPSAS